MVSDPWTWVHAGSAAVFGTLVLATLRNVYDVPALEPLEPQPEGNSTAAPVTVVVPARDEAARIATTVERLLAQVSVAIEVVVVDDRSADGTGAIVAAIAARDPRVRLVRVDELPANWLGKPHACQRGGEAARADWILFTDGDIALAPDVLARALQLARRERADHVVLAPDSKQETFAARVLLGAFAAAMLRELALANRDSKWRQVGIGAFNLVRAEAWRAIGGHRRLAFEVVDDLRLGLLLRRGGFRTRARLALHDVEADWGGTVPKIFGALEKNMFAQLGYSVVLCCAAVAFILALFAVAISGAFAGTVAGWCAFGAWAALAIPGFVTALREKRPLFSACCVPIGFPVLALVLLWSMIQTLRRGGVVWRGRLYPLARLRALRVR